MTAGHGPRFEVTRALTRSGEVEISDGRDLDRDGEIVRLVVLKAVGASVDTRVLLERTRRFALGNSGLVLPVGIGDAITDGKRAIAIGFSLPSQTLDPTSLPLEPERVATVISAIARALGALHDQGVALGCLRPELIAISDDAVRVGGFGVAQLARAVAGPRLARDALPQAYRAPELRGDVPGWPETWSDVYALGALTAELLLGSDARRVLESASEASAPLGLGAVEPIVARALAKSITARPGDVRSWAATLVTELTSSKGVAVAPPATPSHAPPSAAAVGDVETAVPSAAPPPTCEVPTPKSAPPPPPAAPRSEPPGRPKSSLAVAAALTTGLFLLSVGLGGVFTYALLVAPRSTAPPAGPSLPSRAAGAPGIAGGAAPTAAVSPSAAMPLAESDEPEPDVDIFEPVSGARTRDEDARAAIPVEAGEPVWGSVDALVTIVVFGDFDCPHTRRAWPALVRLKHKLGGDLRIVWRNRPLPGHEHGSDAALYAAALFASAGDEPFFRLLSAASKSSEPATVSELSHWTPKQAKKHSDDASVSALARTRLARDLDIAGQLRVRGTPTLFVNGLRIDGYGSFDALENVVERERAASRAVLAKGVDRRELYPTRALKNFVNVGADVP